jgi:hypothetical protein
MAKNVHHRYRTLPLIGWNMFNETVDGEGRPF